MRIATRLLALVGAAGLISAPLIAGAQTVKITAKSAGKGKVVLTLAIPAGYHIYGPVGQVGVPTSITLKSPAGVKIVPNYPKTRSYKGLEDTAQIYSGKVVIPVKLTGTARGKQTLKLSVRTQMCTDRMCLPPAEAAISMGVRL